MTDLDGDTTTATRGKFGRAVNDAGRVVGQNSEGKAASFSGATEVVLLSATSHAADGSVAYDLNESGQLLIENSTDASVLIVDTIDSSLTVIPQIGTGNRMFPKAINEDGDAVGQGDRTPGTSREARGFVYLDDDAISHILEDHTIFTGSDTPGSATGNGFVRPGASTTRGTSLARATADSTAARSLMNAPTC